MCQLYLKLYSPKIHVRYFVIGHNISQSLLQVHVNLKYQLYVVCFVQNIVIHTSFINTNVKAMAQKMIDQCI